MRYMFCVVFAVIFSTAALFAQGFSIEPVADVDTPAPEVTAEETADPAPPQAVAEETPPAEATAAPAPVPVDAAPFSVTPIDGAEAPSDEPLDTPPVEHVDVATPVKDAEPEIFGEPHSNITFEDATIDTTTIIEIDSAKVAADTIPIDPKILPSGRVSLALLWIESETGHNRVAVQMTDVIVEELVKFELYDIYPPNEVEHALRESNVRVSSDCRSDKCAFDKARALGIARTIFGTIDMVDSMYGVRLTLMNAANGRIIATANIKGAQGEPARNVVATAVNMLHGAEPRISVKPYYGPPLNNSREFLWSLLAVQGTGLAYGLINYYGATGGARDDINYGAGGPYNKDDALSGVPASSNQIPMFARPTALANAYTAVSDDAYGVLYNPAGMAWLTHKDAAIAYQNRFGLDLLAVTYVNRIFRDAGFGQAVLVATDRDGAMTEMFFVTALGYKINEKILFGPMSFGASVKTMGNTVRALSPDSPRGQSFGIGLDLGFMWELSRDIRYGLLIRDAQSINRWHNRTTDTRYYEHQPPTLHMGGSYKSGYSTFLTADGQIPLYADQPWIMAGGIEYEFFRMLALRIGLQRQIMDEDVDWWKITGGAGIKIDTRSQWGKNMEFDFAYEYNTLRLFPVVNVSLKIGF